MKNNDNTKYFSLYLDDLDDDNFTSTQSRYHSLCQTQQLVDKMFNLLFINEFAKDELRIMDKYNPNGLNFNYRYSIVYAKLCGDYGKYKKVYGFVFNNTVVSIYSASNLDYRLIDLFIKKLVDCGINISREIIKSQDCAKFNFSINKYQLECLLSGHKEKMIR